MADVHFMEAYGLYFSYSHLWVLGFKGYLAHGPYFLGYDRSRSRKRVKFDCMTAFLNCCVPRADCNCMEAYVMYFWHILLWVLCLKSYLVHGHYFLGYDRPRTRKWVKFDHFWGPLGPRVTQHMDLTSLDMIVQQPEIEFSSTVWQPIWAVAAQGHISIL